ncbi:histidine phosphatase family protein [Sporosarcina saromensis]|uniref:Histidine phosphatase family protein n=1 Tax=Sporosarcina saromensis TaxID=359365 RepID=A0ABU4GC56_9BACL|nr:histidine phosphatase family protein [Sporosarcina saromensis]MDW0113903.1 histidine phosphatase family protein [Sporosarcina saromensis]
MARPHTLYLIRHLPTAGNRAKKYIGWTDEPIEPIAEPETFRLSGMQQNIVYGSDLRRARQSANLFLPHAIFHEDRRFRECHFGDFEGKTYAPTLNKIRTTEIGLIIRFNMHQEAERGLRTLESG